MLGRSNAIENDLSDVRVGWILKCDTLSLLQMDAMHVWDVFTVLTKDLILKKLNMMNCWKAKISGRERASKIWETFWAESSNKVACISHLLDFSSNAVSFSCKRLPGTTSVKSPVSLNTFRSQAAISADFVFILSVCFESIINCEYKFSVIILGRILLPVQ